MTINYPNFVDKQNIYLNGSASFRYFLRIPFINYIKDKFLVVILKNPSVANSAVCDRTIYKICFVAYKYKYKGVIILNLFPYRSTRPKNVVNFYNNPNFATIMNNNLNSILQTSKNNDVVFAWGTNTISKSITNTNIYNNAVANVVANVTNVTKNIYYVDKCRCANAFCSIVQPNINHPIIRYPLHGLRWNKNSNLIKY